ncbi:tyrosine-type recombinase/integrase [Vibrio rotiferianus]|uniref:tyrosine-type recombinase/integrase n=1 Tax=Vibrio rotiferianus TaxID=190895 RepID=UPI0028941F4B|nr:Phage_integrase domain-containing protein [Vibrio rotiferianus]CAH1589558.1 Phage_integrase domain-containing protein [Vibrio rotiferianus]
MYLFKSPSGTYYTRLCFPKYLRSKGFPFDVKVSLCTKERAIAVSRNAALIAKLHPTIHTLPSTVHFKDFKPILDDVISDVRGQFSKNTSQPLNVSPSSLYPTSLSLKSLLEQFISSKRLDGITHLSISQLQQRNQHFIETVSVTQITEVRSSVAMDYRDKLLSQGRSHKTNRDYFAAIKQFMNWCVAKEYLSQNPFIGIKLPKGSGKVSEDRSRWTQEEICYLTHHKHYRASDEQLRIAFELVLRHGARPAEICQLLTAQVHFDCEIPYLSISEEADSQHVKNAHSCRLVPIHRALLDGRFEKYARARKALGKKQLFDFMPLGPDKNWSKQLTSQFGKLLTSIGWKPKHRPTLYGLRHTFIDELKQTGAAEHVVAQIVGHRHPNMTFGRYGKDIDLANLAKHVNLFSIEIGVAHESN